MGFPVLKYDERYIGEKNNYLTVIGITRFEKSGHRAFVCRCDCGKEKLVEPCHWERGIVKSCGCMHNILASKNSKTHGLSSERIYHVWQGMISRCENENSESYSNYGGRGIRVCKEWHDVEKFVSWAYLSGYDENAERGECTIDRIDVNGNYEPSNCRWTTISEQNNNKRPSSEWKKRNGTFEYQGKLYQLKELCEEFNTSEPALRYRMKTLGMSLIEALETPKMTMGRPRKQVSNGR